MPLGFLKKKRTREGTSDPLQPAGHAVLQAARPDLHPGRPLAFQRRLRRRISSSSSPSARIRPRPRRPGAHASNVGPATPVCAASAHSVPGDGAAEPAADHLEPDQPAPRSTVPPPTMSSNSRPPQQQQAQSQFPSPPLPPPTNGSVALPPSSSPPLQKTRVTKGKYSLGDFEILRTLGTGSFGSRPPGPVATQSEILRRQGAQEGAGRQDEAG